MESHRFRPRLTLVGSIVGLTATYWVTGRLGLMLAIPPGYATAVWPPSGVALAGILLLGYRAWPGILLGSFLLNLETSYDTSTLASIIRTLVIPVAIGWGASLQAVVGAFLIRRFVGFPTPLDRERDVINLLLLGGPASCLLNATIGVATLLLTGVIPYSSFAYSWGTWWVGDSMGVLIFTPLAFILFARPRTAWSRRSASVGLPLVVAFAAVVALIKFTSRAEETRLESEFQQSAELLARRIRRGFADCQHALAPLAGVFEAFGEVDYNAFLRVAEPLVSRQPGMLRVAWSPRVLDDERGNFEAATRREGYPDFQITEVDSEGRRRRALSRSEYIVIRFMEPVAGNEDALGFDLASDPIRLGALRRACEEASPSATGPLSHTHGEPNRVSIAIFVPVFADGGLSPRCERLRGVVAGVFYIDEIINATARFLEHEGLVLMLSDQAASPGILPHFLDKIDLAGRSATTIDGNGLNDRFALSTTRSFDFGGRPWKLQVSAGLDYVARRQTAYAWTVSAGGLVYTGLLGSFLLVLTSRTVKIERLVSERTKELSHTNAALAQEITERKEAEWRFRKLIESAPDAMVIVNMAGKIILVNSQTERLFGYSRSELFEEYVEVLIPQRLHAEHKRHRAVYVADPQARPMGLGLTLSGRRKDGSEFPVEISLSPLATGEGLLVSSVIRDVTDRKRLEEEGRRHREELAHVSRLATMGALSAGLAHELNQPLCAIVSNADAARRMLESTADAPEHMRETLKDIAHGAMRAADIIQHLRDFVRKGTPERTRLDINKVVREIRDFIESDVTQHRATLRYELAKGGLPVLGDRIQLQQVILNLVRNGLDAMVTMDPDSRILTIRTSQLETDEIEVAVQDRGVGLSQELIDRVFEPFVTTKPEGLGMGLSISRALVEAFGGRLTGSPNADGGATFCIYLPVLEDDKDHEVRSNRDHRRRR